MTHRWRNVLIVRGGVILSFLSLPTWAAALTNDAIVKQIKAEKVFKEDVTISSAIQLPTVTLETPSAPNRSQRDLKIDAVLLAKAIMDIDPKSVTRVIVKFTDKASCKEISVTAGDIRSYGLGAISTDQLLSSIEIVDKEVQDNKTTSLSQTVRLSDSQPGRDVSELSGLFTSLSAESEIYQTEKFAALLAVANKFIHLDRDGVNTEPFVSIFDEAYNLVDQNQLAKAQDVIQEQLRSNGKSYNLGAGKAKPEAVDSKRDIWQTRQAKLKSRLQAKLGEDMPLHGISFAYRVLIAARIHQLAQEGKDVSAYRAKLQELNLMAMAHDAAKLRPAVAKLKAEMGLTLAKEDSEP